MKTSRQHIQEIKVNSANAEYIATTGIINGSLLVDLEKAFESYAKDKVNESLRGMSKDDSNIGKDSTHE
ncbi:hypothetical protein D3C87_447590 [compost metagenome]